MNPDLQSFIDATYDMERLTQADLHRIKEVCDGATYGLTPYDRQQVQAILDTVRRPTAPSDPPADPLATGSVPIDNTRPAEAVALEKWASVLAEGDQAFAAEIAADIKVVPLGTYRNARMSAVGGDGVGYMAVVTNKVASERATDIFKTVADAEQWCRNLIDQRVVAIDLSPFCQHGDQGKYDLSKPFVQRGHRYATDGAACVRYPVSSEADSVGNVPNAAGLPWPVDVDADRMLPWPAAAYVWQEQKIGDEGGDAKPVASKNADADDGPVYIWLPLPSVQEVGSRMIASHRHYVIARLQNVRYLPDGGPTDPLYFTFDGGEGIVMPVKLHA